MALSWTDTQREIAALLNTGKTAYVIGEKEKLFGKSMVYEVSAAIKAGDTPEAFDALRSAEDKERSAEYGGVEERRGGGAEDSLPDEQESKPNGNGKLKTALEIAMEKTGGNGKKAVKVEPKGPPLTIHSSEAALLRMELKTQVMPQTPAMLAGFFCAVRRGFPGNMEGFLSIAAVDYWLGRSIDPFLATSGFEKTVEEAMYANRQGPGVGDESAEEGERVLIS